MRAPHFYPDIRLLRAMWRGLETWPRENCEPPEQSKELDWKPSPYSARASSRPYHWLATHPRCVFHFPPVHCSWMNQVKQWFSIVQRKRLRIADFADKKHLSHRLLAFVAEWNTHAHPFQWSTKSVANVMAKCESPLAEAA